MRSQGIFWTQKLPSEVVVRRSSLGVELIDKPAVVDLSQIVHVPERHRVRAFNLGMLALGELEYIADRRKGRVGLLLENRRELFVHVLDDLVVPAVLLEALGEDLLGLR